MNAYRYFFGEEIAQKTAVLNKRPSAAQNALTKPQLEFLNSHACQHVSPYNKRFWPELIASLTPKSKQAAVLPPAWNYRSALEPYLLRRVHMTTDSWYVKSCGQDDICLLLRNVRLRHVYDSAIGASPDVTVDHLNVWVSTGWFNRIAPACGEALALDGVLYQYANAKQTRNISLLPVLAIPASRKTTNWKNLAACPGTPAFQDIAA